VRWLVWRIELNFSFSSADLIWNIIYLVICVISFAHMVVIPFQCLDVAVRSDTVRRVIRACFKNWSQLMWSCALLVIFVLIYSFFVFYNFNAQYDDASAGNMCKDTFQCFIMVLYNALRQPGGVGDVLEVAPYSRSGNVTDYISRVFFDLTFFIMVITITLHLVFGMIVDAFKDLRVEKQEHLEDQENICYICGLEKSEYERYGDFEDHTEESHNPWNYLFYIVYLKDKFANRSNEFTEIETYIYTRYLTKNVEWFPMGERSLEYEKFLAEKHVSKESNETDELFEIVENIEKDLKNMKNLKNFVEEYVEKEKKTKPVPSQVKIESGDPAAVDEEKSAMQASIFGKLGDTAVRNTAKMGTPKTTFAKPE